MYSSIEFKKGDARTLVDTFNELIESQSLGLNDYELENPELIDADCVLAVHFADGGAQGEPGAVDLLYCMPDGVHILHGNYCSGNLDLDAVIEKLPILQGLDNRSNKHDPFPFGGDFQIPDNWGYVYMGALNHFLARQEICAITNDFIKILLSVGGNGWKLFDAVAWYCGAK